MFVICKLFNYLIRSRLFHDYDEASWRLRPKGKIGVVLCPLCFITYFRSHLLHELRWSKLMATGYLHAVRRWSSLTAMPIGFRCCGRATLLVSGWVLTKYDWRNVEADFYLTALSTSCGHWFCEGLWWGVIFVCRGFLALVGSPATTSLQICALSWCKEIGGSDLGL